MLTLFRTYDQTTAVEEGPDPAASGAGSAGTVASATARARHWDYFGKSSRLRFGPEAYLVELDAHRIVRAHYHSVDQFQLMYGGTGATYKRAEVPQLLLHFADAFTTYGPFAAGYDAFQFWTLRPAPSDVTGFMPESRDELPRNAGKRRHVLTDLTPMVTESVPKSGAQVRVAMADSHGNALAHLVCAGPGVALTPPAVGERGTYMVPVSGHLEDDEGHRFDSRSVGWISQVDQHPETSVIRVDGELRSAATGCRVLFLHF